MAIVAKDSGGGDFKPAPAGLHPAVCVDVVDLGMRDGTWGPKHKVRLAWQIDETDPDTGKRYLVSQMYTLSLHEKASLRRDLESWRSRPFTEEELAGFDLERLLGAPCQLQVMHTKREQKTYANVKAVVPLAKGMEKMAPKDYVRVKDRKDTPEPGEVTEEEDAEQCPF